MGKVFRSGFYWPRVLNDAIELVRSYEALQFYAKQIHQPAQGIQTIPLSWSFEVWGLDILGPFPRAPGGYRYLYVAINKFTKWAEVEPVHTIPTGSAVKFTKGLMSWFGVPNRIITDNGSRFTSKLFETYCPNHGTQICYTSTAHPWSNGQAERTNTEFLRGLNERIFKEKLEDCDRGWVEELQSVLWSIRTFATKPMGENPFFLVYGAKAVLPHEVRHRSARVLAFEEAC